MKQAWSVVASPLWKDCPMKLQATIITEGGQDRAIELFRENCKNDKLEISEAIPTSIIVDPADPIEPTA